MLAIPISVIGIKAETSQDACFNHSTGETEVETFANRDILL